MDREPLIYHLDSMSRHSADHVDLPDEFFEVTVDDVRRRFAQLKSERCWGGQVSGSDVLMVDEAGSRLNVLFTYELFRHVAQTRPR